MTSAVALADGRFMYLLKKNGNIYLGTPTPHCEPAQESLLFGGSAAAFAFLEEKGLVAILRREDDNILLTVYQFENDELAMQLNKEKTVVHPSSSAVMWANGGDCLVVSNETSKTTLYQWSEGKVVPYPVADSAPIWEHGKSNSFSALHYIGTVDDERETVRFFDSQKGKLVETYSVAEGKKHVASLCGHRNFVFIVEDDGTMHAVYVTKGSIRKLQGPLKDFCPSEASPAAAESGAAVIPRVVCNAISSGQVLVAVSQPVKVAGRSGPFIIGRYKYVKKLASIPIIEKAVVHPNYNAHPGSVCSLEAINAEGQCLLRYFNAQTGAESLSVDTLTYEVAGYRKTLVDSEEAGVHVDVKARHAGVPAAAPAAVPAGAKGRKVAAGAGNAAGDAADADGMRKDVAHAKRSAAHPTSAAPFHLDVKAFSCGVGVGVVATVVVLLLTGRSRRA